MTSLRMNNMSAWTNRLSRYPLKVEIAGSNPVADT